ncbi:MAG: phenylacetate--CoA ligase family protein [Actinomycetes bacterium]
MPTLADRLQRYTTGLDDDIAKVVREAAALVPAFRDRLRMAGLDPGGIRGAHDLDRLPPMSKDDVFAMQRAHPPYGGMLASGVHPPRVFQSPGPLYEPQLSGADPWRWGEALRALGVGPGDVVLNCFGYHLSPAGAMFDEGARALGATVVPAGVGSIDLQARLVGELGVTAYTGLPSYLKALVERAIELGEEPRGWRLDRALVTAEPLPDSLREWLQGYVPVVRQAYGTAETGLLAYETGVGGGLQVAEGVLVQVCDLDGRHLVDDSEGQLVVTLMRPEFPVVRFGTGDISAWLDGDGDDADAAGPPRLVGVLGRVGQAVKVRGMFLHPHQAGSAMEGVPGVAAYRFLVDRDEHRDRLTLEVVPAVGSTDPDLPRAVRARVRAELRFDVDVQLVDGLPEDSDMILDRRDWS